MSCPYGEYDIEGDFDCTLGSPLECDDCKYGSGRKDPFAKCNLPEGTFIDDPS